MSIEEFSKEALEVIDIYKEAQVIYNHLSCDPLGNGMTIYPLLDDIAKAVQRERHFNKTIEDLGGQYDPKA